jgi:hypothetical protein
MARLHDGLIEISALKASGGIKLGSARYVLFFGIALAGIAGAIIWNIFAR